MLVKTSGKHRNQQTVCYQNISSDKIWNYE